MENHNIDLNGLPDVNKFITGIRCLYLTRLHLSEPVTVQFITRLCMQNTFFCDLWVIILHIIEVNDELGKLSR